MKKLNVAETVGGVLVTEASGRDLFGFLLELYVEGDRDEEIDLNFQDILTLSSFAMKSFVGAAQESNVLPLHRLRQQVYFSGLLINDIETVSSAFSDGLSDVLNQEAAKQQMEEVMNRLKESPAIGSFDLSKIIQNLSHGKELDLNGLSSSLEKLDKFLKKV